MNKWIVWLLPKSLTQPSHLSFFFILTWREKRRNEVGWPAKKFVISLYKGKKGKFFSLIFGDRYWNVRKLSALPVVDEAVFWCTHTHPRLPPPPSVQYVWTWNPFYFFFGRKTNLLFLCWLWENVLVFLTLWEKGKKKATALGHQFPLSQSRKWSLCCCFWFFHELALHTNRLSRSLMNELLFLPSSLL